jgi:hypothetical protein
MIASAAFLLMAALQAPANAGSEINQVQVCSVVAGTCSSLPAPILDPTLRPLPQGGQLAFVDPQTGVRVEPTGEQMDDLQQEITLSEERKSLVEPTIERLPNGTLHAHGDFRTYLRVELKPATAKGSATSARPAAAPSDTATTTAPEQKP